MGCQLEVGGAPGSGLPAKAPPHLISFLAKSLDSGFLPRQTMIVDKDGSSNWAPDTHLRELRDLAWVPSSGSNMALSRLRGHLRSNPAGRDLLSLPLFLLSHHLCISLLLK